MNMGSLAKVLMKKTIAFAGNGTKAVSIILLGNVVYDPVTGDSARNDVVVPIGNALLGPVSEMEAARYKLTTTSHKAIVAALDYNASGAADPHTFDKITIDSKAWLIEKVMIGPFDELIWFFVCEA